jgi:hypothetical protein
MDKFYKIHAISSNHADFFVMRETESTYLGPVAVRAEGGVGSKNFAGDRPLAWTHSRFLTSFH